MDIWIRIKSLFDGKGTADAAQGVSQVGAAARNAAPAFGAQRESADKAFGAINAATQVTEGGLSGVGAAVRNIGSQFPKLSAAVLGPIGLIIAGIAAWKKVVDTLVAAHETLRANLRLIALGNVEARIKRETEAYDALTLAMRRSADERQRDLDIAQSKDDAQLRSELAKLELEKAQRLAYLAPDDDIGRRDVELDVQTRRGSLEDEASRRKSDREALSLSARESDQIAARIAARQQQIDLEKHYAEISAQYTSVMQRAKKDAEPNRFFSMSPVYSAYMAFPEVRSGRQEESFKKHLPVLDQIKPLLFSAFEKIQSARDDQYSADQSLVETRAKRGVNQIDRGTAATQTEARQVNEWTAGTDIDTAKNEEMKVLAEKLNVAGEGTSALFRNYARLELGRQGVNRETMIFLIAAAEKNARDIADRDNARRLRQ